ncbi:MAG: DUF3737 family protein [Lachnospiraceae bacterium]|nr:DUF3737 family protein [Lachnospiraceae bacterium]
MTEYVRQLLKGERALWKCRGARITDCVFEDGESPLKEGGDLEIEGCLFRWKYPLWYCSNVHVSDSTWFEMARAGVWYTKDMTVENCLIQAPKNFRRCSGLTLSGVTFTNAAETLWSCRDLKLRNVTAKGDYFAMNCEKADVDGLTLDGNYSFDGAKDVTISNSTLITKDAFWNSENVTVRDSFISGEYLGWNSKNLTLIDCTIESLQGMCYIDGLRMINCKVINTTLAFEYSQAEAELTTRIDSVFNPAGGHISAPAIGELILEKDEIDPAKTQIDCPDIERSSDRPEWKRD